MLNSITVTNHLNESLELILSDPNKSGLNIYDITGIGPGNADIITTPMAYVDGTLFNSSRKGQRNIVIMMYLNPLPSVEVNRHKTYKYFPLKRKVTIKFESSLRTSEITGYVESNEPIMFSEKSFTQISIICPDPYFYAAGDNPVSETLFSGVRPLFHFPFANEGLDVKTLAMGDIETKVEYNVPNLGDSEVGITIVMNAFGGVNDVRLYNLTTNQRIRIDTDKLTQMTGKAIVAGDEIIISTIKGSKSATLIRDGKLINILNCLDRDINWIELAIGDNIFSFTAETSAVSHPSNLQIVVRNRILYEGV